MKPGHQGQPSPGRGSDSLDVLASLGVEEANTTLAISTGPPQARNMGQMPCKAGLLQFEKYHSNNLEMSTSSTLPVCLGIYSFLLWQTSGFANA